MPDKGVFEKKDPIRKNRNPNLEKFEGKASPKHFLPLLSRPDCSYKATKTLNLELSLAMMSRCIQMRPMMIQSRKKNYWIWDKS